jgi:radical SAM protein with 4Fe4S-binding SPASM domain
MVPVLPRLPLEGNLDLTYRCNLNCRHCWNRLPAGSPEKQLELSIDEIASLAADARKMGCRRWSMSGGEPMLRADFTEIFEVLTDRSVSYTLNSNGTLITPAIARQLRRKGTKLVALYGATKDVYEHVTRTPGSFERALRGFAYLKEAGADFMVQVIPMRDNAHQFREMVEFADSLDRPWRVGAAWLYLSACRDSERNREILRQRLEPQEVIELDPPSVSLDGQQGRGKDPHCLPGGKVSPFARCIAARRDFHIDPYGRMSSCAFVQDPDLRYDLRRGSFQEGWEQFIPSLKDRVRPEPEYQENCGSCEHRDDCRFCPVYAHLEHGSLSARIDYLCELARETRAFTERWRREHRRCFRIGGLTVQVAFDLPIRENTFHPKFKLFEVEDPGKDNVSLRHHFSLPDLDGRDLGEVVTRCGHWIVSRKGNSWIYQGGASAADSGALRQLAVFSRDHTQGEIYHRDDTVFRDGLIGSLSLLPTDELPLARALAGRQGCYFHASGVELGGQGLLFAGTSGAGKSTIATMLGGVGRVLCDERVIVRRLDDGFHIWGTWSHDEMSVGSPHSAPLRAIFFLRQSAENRVLGSLDRRVVVRELLNTLVRPLMTADWWDRMLALMERLVREVPAYELHFDQGGGIVPVLQDLVRSGQ